jgi:hypothetical protein
MRFDGAQWTSITDCRDLFPPVTELISLLYVGGDGQEAMPGEPLPQPLQVRVANGQWPVPGRRVRFSVIEGGGSLSASQPVATVAPDGLAQCEWTLGATVGSAQRVEAVLLDSADNPLPGQIVAFNANQSIASEVAYDPGACPTMSGQVTVQSAIDRLAQVASLYEVGGNGQTLLPGQTLQPVVVRAANRCGALAGMSVNWLVLSGGGSVSASSTTTDVDGETSVTWSLGPGFETQELQAELVASGGRVVAEPTRVVFTARQEAEGAAPEPAIQVVGLRANGLNGPLTNGMLLSPDELSEGLRVLCSLPVDPDTVRDGFSPNGFDILRQQPTCFVTAEIPYPMTRSELNDWASTNGTFVAIGYRPLVLRAETEAQGATISWRPPPPIVQWLRALLDQLVIQKTGHDRVLARLTLKGNFITQSGQPNVYLDGEVFRSPTPPGLRLPSGDARRGGDLEMWFWISNSPREPILVVQPPLVTGGPATGILQLSSAVAAATVVTLTSSDPAVAQVPPSMDLPAGAREGRFQIEAVGGAQTVVVTITATFEGQTASGTLTREGVIIRGSSPGREGSGSDAPEDPPSERKTKPKGRRPRPEG